MAKKKVFEVLIDIDACFYHGVPARFSGSLAELKKLLLETNKSLLAHILKIIGDAQYDTIIIGLGSNRQSKKIDDVNASRSTTCAPAMPILQHHLSGQVHPHQKVWIEPILMADVYAPRRAAGESYHAILRAVYQSSQEEHTDWMFDNSKISIVYAHMHRLATLHPDAELTINFYDDSTSILAPVYYFFSQHPELMPNGLRLNLYKYEGKEVVPYEKPITGAGVVDRHYAWSIRYFYVKNFYFSDHTGETGRRQQAENNDAVSLARFHSENLYGNGRRESEMTVRLEFARVFFSFRQEHIPQLPDEAELWGVPAYTTAEALISLRLMPETITREPVAHLIPTDSPLKSSPKEAKEGDPLLPATSVESEGQRRKGCCVLI